MRASRRPIAGPLLAVLALVGIGAAGTAAGRSEPTEVIDGPPISEVRSYAERPELPVTYAEALAAGTVEDYDWGDHCDVDRRYNDTETTLARVDVPSTYSPPCVPVWEGEKPWVSRGGRTFTDNGGATAPGVDAATIKVVFYVPAELDIARQLEQFGVADDGATTLAGIESLVAMYNNLFETYGRKVVVEPFYASGDGRSPSAAKADAVRVVESGAFASIGGPAQTSSYQHELARNQVLCVQCGYASTDQVLATDAPYAWGYLASPDQLLFGSIKFGANALGESNAVFAGDPKFRRSPRKFGVVHYEQDPPAFGLLRDEALSRYSATGQSADVIVPYLLDPNSLNAQAQAIVGRLKREGITSVVFLGDPLMPRVLLQQASKQDYWPEWLFTGTVFTDTSVVARLYDQEQMAHAFGLSSAPARTTPEVAEDHRLFEWWYGEPPKAPKTMLFWGPVVQMLFIGIHMAGPELRAENFAGGMFRYPPTGGRDTTGLEAAQLYLEGYLNGDVTPAISFGFRDGSENVDYVAVDDFTSSWWAADERGPDESGGVGDGMWMAMGLGLRFDMLNPVPPEGAGQEFLFRRKLSETASPLAEMARAAGLPDLPIASGVLEQTPMLDQVPDVERWPESPAAGG